MLHHIARKKTASVRFLFLFGLIFIGILFIADTAAATTYFVAKTKAADGLAASDTFTGLDNTGLGLSEASLTVNGSIYTLIKTGAFASYTPTASDYIYATSTTGAWTALFTNITKTDADTLSLGTLVESTGTLSSQTDVATTNGPRLTIQSMVDALPAGTHTIKVGPGSFSQGAGYLLFDAGENGKNITINGSTVASTTITSTGAYAVYVDSTSGSLTMSNFTATSSATTAYLIRHNKDAVSVTLSDCTLGDAGPTNQRVLSWNATSANPPTRDLTIQRCTLNSKGTQSLGFLNDIRSLTIEDSILNAISNNTQKYLYLIGRIGTTTVRRTTATGGGLFLDASTVTALTAIDVQNNTVTANDYGILVPNYAQSATISGNTFHITSTIGVHGISLGQNLAAATAPLAGITITDNTVYFDAVHDIASHGILIGFGADNAIVSGNKVGPVGIGLIIKGDNAFVHNNLLNADNHGGLLLKGTHNSTIVNNSAYSTGGEAAIIQNSIAPAPLLDAENNSIYNNIFHGGTSGSYAINYNGSAQAAWASNLADHNTYIAGTGGLATMDTTLKNSLSALMSTWVASSTTVLGRSNDSHSNTADPQFLSVDTTSSSYLKPGFVLALLDAGTTTSAATDYLGNPIYGTPDIGAYEYQPPFTITADKIDPTGNVRIYGDGQYRYTSATSTTMNADLQVVPAEGSFAAHQSFSATAARPEWLNISNITWGATKEFTASSSIATTTIYTIGDLTPSAFYTITLDSATTTSITGASCTEGVCRASDTGSVTFTYSGGYSTHTFGVAPDTASPALSLSAVDSTANGAWPLFAWTSTDPAGLDHFDLYVDGVLNVASIASTTFATHPYRALTCGTSHPWSVVSVDRAGNTASATSTYAVGCSAGNGAPIPAPTPSIPVLPQATATPTTSDVVSFVPPASQPAVKPTVIAGPTPTLVSRDLARGMTGADVKALQVFLNAHGFSVAKVGPGSAGNETTYFGPATRAALIKFQRANKIKPALGYFGPLTRARIK